VDEKNVMIGVRKERGRMVKSGMRIKGEKIKSGVKRL
jgi:hypothetical protein